MIEQLNTLFTIMVTGCHVDSKSPLVRMGLAVIHNKPDIVADQIPLSAFNVLLSEKHGLYEIPVVGC